MDRLEFSDVYKFIASIGLLLIGLSVLLPWFINHDADFLLIDEKKLNTLTIAAQHVISSQQNSLLKFNQHILWFSPMMFAGGLYMVIWAILYWRKRQLVVDGIQDEELRSRKLQNISNSEKREMIKDDIIEIDDLQDENEQKDQIDIAATIEEKIDEYINIENILYTAISKYSTTEYQTLQNVKIPDATFDIVMRSKVQSRDRLLEIKYFKSQLNLSVLEKNVQQLIVNSKLYKSTVKRDCMPFLFIIYDEEHLIDLLIQYKKSLQNLGVSLNSNIRVNFFKKSEVENDRIKNFLSDSPKLLTS